jgi:TPR repeat protein
MIRFLSIALLSFCYILSAQADIYSASNALSRGDFEIAVAEFTKLAEKGDANAQANLGYMYYAGEGVPQDYEKAVYWYRKAAVQGNKDAQYNLAVSYAFGEGVKQDLTEAAIWYRRAGEQNHVVSQYSLGISYAYGEGVPQDQKEAARWFKKAADQGYARAQVNLGSMYHTGEGVDQDYTEAARWYRMAADRGDATAQYNLGAMYRQGKGVEQNYAQAKRWFRQSADQGYAAAQNELASLERSAAANVATRTIQTKPELPAVKETAPEPAPTKKVEPKEEIVAVQKTEAKEPVQTTSPEVSESKKKPLFSVEKEGLLSLDESELDITEPKTTIEPEIKEVVTQAKEIIPVETTVAETEITEASELDTSTIHNALGLPTPTNPSSATEETESSGGFFSKLFSSKEMSEADTLLAEAETIVEIEETAPEPKVKKEVVITPRIYPEDVKAAELATIEKTKIDNEIIEFTPEPQAEEEVIPVETVIDETEIAEVSEPESDYSAIHNALGFPAPTANTESSGSFFDKLFSSKETSETDASLTETETIVEIVEVEPVEKTAPEPKFKKDLVITPRTYPEDVRAAELAVIEKTEIDEEVVASENSWAETASDTPGTIDETESSGGLFSAIGDFFSSKDKKNESTISESEVESDDVLIAKAEESTPVIEEIELAHEAEIDLSQYSIDAGRRALTNNDYDEALSQFKPLAEAGDSEAQSYLGSLYYVGKGVSKDFNEAYNWYKKSADQGNMDAQYSIGNMYLLGEGVEQNNSDAEKWYLLASKQGHIAAKSNLASLKKLESLNRKNQLQLDTIAAEQKTKEEVASEAIEFPEEIVALDEETTESSSEAIIKKDKKPGLLGFFGGLFEKKSSENESTQEDDAVNVISEPELSATEVVELEQANTNITTYAAVEAPSTKSLQTLPNEERAEDNQGISNFSEIAPIVEDSEQSNNVAALDDSQSSTSESPSFFKSLFGNDELEKTDEADNIELESPEEITNINDESAESEEKAGIEVEEPINESDDAIAEITEEPVSTEKSGGLFGFIGNIFSSGNKNEIDNSESEVPEDIAMLEPEIDRVSTNIDEAIVEDTIVITEIERLRPLAIQGDQNAQYELGALYYSGNEVKQDYSQAALWYRRAAEQGNVDAQFSLGNMFLMGEGIAQDDSQATHWYALAAKQGHNSAKHNLESLKILQKTQASNPRVETEVATNSDQLISLDDENTVKSAINSDTDGKSEYEQGLAYAFGDGVAQNDRTAFNLFYESAEKGYVLAQYKVGVAFAYGEGVRQDQKKAAEWYRKSAEQGYTIAQRNLALMYLDGKGVEKNKVQALAWYQIVANAGNAMDLRRRDMLKSELTDAELSESQELSKQISSQLTNPSL